MKKRSELESEKRGELEHDKRNKIPVDFLPLDFDRKIALGSRLDIPSGPAVRFEPGQIRVVSLIPFKGKKKRKLNKMPLMPIFEGIAILIAGAFLLTPGFLTDTLGCFLLIPKTRNILIKLISSYLKKNNL